MNEQANPTILVIDDEPAVREAVTDILELEDCRVITAKSGEEGIRRYQEEDEIHLVILDLSMPQMGGEETLRHLQEIDPNVRVLLSSGYSENELSGRFDRYNVAGFLQKPYNALHLIETVRAYL